MTTTLQQEQRTRELAVQDEMLDALHASVMTTKDYAERIGTELSEQDAMLDRLHTGVEIANSEASKQTKSVGQLIVESKHRGFYAIVIVLLLIIVVLIAI